MKTIIGVDMGGTKINAGQVQNGKVTGLHQCKVESAGSEGLVMEQLCRTIEALYDDTVEAIGIGVPSLVDVKQGIVFDVQNIPSWKEAPVAEVVGKRFGVEVRVNNDANCFAIGEKVFGAAAPYQNFVGMTLGTGLGSGIFCSGKLVSGANCGAGEFGSIPYLEDILETYCSGKFFKMRCGLDGLETKKRAEQADPEALALFSEYGMHLGNAIKTVMLSVDPEAVILGGSISRDFPLFRDSLWEQVRTFPYQRSVDKLQILPSTLDHSPVLGAAALCLIDL